MLLLGEQDFAASNHDSFDANSLVMVTLRQATSARAVPFLYFVQVESLLSEQHWNSLRASTFSLRQRQNLHYISDSAFQSDFSLRMLTEFRGKRPAETVWTGV